jgi:hypothetical protein
MKSIAYWMFLQMFIGVWLLISPFVIGYEEMRGLVANNMIIGGFLVTLGLSVILYTAFECEDYSGMGSHLHMGRTLRKL